MSPEKKKKNGAPLLGKTLGPPKSGPFLAQQINWKGFFFFFFNEMFSLEKSPRAKIKEQPKIPVKKTLRQGNLEKENAKIWGKKTFFFGKKSPQKG